MKNAQMAKWCFIIIVIAGILLVGEFSVFAQGCSMCKTVASAQSDEAGKALNRAILLLLIPPVTIMGAILIWAFRCRNSPTEV